MSVIWKRLQRVNKRAAKYRLVFELQELMVEGTTQWQPNKLSVVLTRRRRRIASQPMHWDPTIRNPYRGLVVWSLPEILDVDVTLYRGPRSTKYEDKEWTIAIEDISSTGRPRRIATKSINISDFVDEQFGATSRHELFKLTMGITSKKVKEVYVTLALSTTFLKEGKATDYDMESVTSMMSVSANDGVRNLDDDEADQLDFTEHSAETSAQLLEITNKFSELLNSKDDEGEEKEEKENDVKSKAEKRLFGKTDDGKADQTDGPSSTGTREEGPPTKSVFYSTVNGVAGKNEVISSVTNSPSGTTPAPTRKAIQFASSAELPGAVINFKAPKLGDNTAAAAVASTATATSEEEKKKRKKGADYERVTHSHESTAAASASSSSSALGARLNDSYSADRDSAVPVITANRLGDKSSSSISTAVYSSDDQVDNGNNLRHLSQSYAAVAASAAATAGDESDLRSSSSSRAPDTIFSDLHSSPSSKGKNSAEDDSRLPSQQQRVDNRPKWTGPSIDESAFLEDNFDAALDNGSEMPVYSAADELLSWCKKVTEGYAGVKITNMTTSWRNGIAFCAIIHHFRPDLIDFDSLKPTEVERNCGLAFDAAFRLGIPKIIEAKDMITLTVPDRLSVMTYLYQLKSFFNGPHSPTRMLSKANSYSMAQYNVLEEEEAEEDSAQVAAVGRSISSQIKSKCLDLFDCLEELDNASFAHKRKSDQTDGRQQQQTTVDNHHQTRGVLSKVAAPTTSQMMQTASAYQKLNTWNDYLENTRNNNHQQMSTASREDGEMNGSISRSSSQTKLMTRKQLMNPFDSDSDEEIELLSKNESKINHEPMTPSSSSTEDSSEDHPRPTFPVRKPLQFANNNNGRGIFTAPAPPSNFPTSRPLPTSYSTASFINYRLPPTSASSVHSGLSKMTTPEPVEVAPGLLDLSSVKAYRLQRALSAPTCQSFSLLGEQPQRPQEREAELRERARHLLKNVRKEMEEKRKEESAAAAAVAAQQSNSSSLSREDERQRMLRERARKMIADAKQGIISTGSTSIFESPISFSSNSNSTTNSTNTPVMSPLEGVGGGGAVVTAGGGGGGHSFDALQSENGGANSSSAGPPFPKYMIKSDFDRTTKPVTLAVSLQSPPQPTATANHSRPQSSASSTTGDGSLENSKAKLFEFSFHKFDRTNGPSEINGNEVGLPAGKISKSASDRLGKVPKSRSQPHHSGRKLDSNSTERDIQAEQEDIEREQKLIDQEAAILEKRLRKLMDTGGNKRLEEKLTYNWFVLVNKRNAVIRRQMQLNIREKEADMTNRYKALNEELRTLCSIDESEKTDAQRAREKKLLDDLVQIVDKRDELVRHLDNQEKAIEEDELVESATQRPITLEEENDKNCRIM